MKGNVTRGSGFRGAVEYVCGKDESPQIVGGNMAGTTPRQLSAEFGASRAIRPDIKKPVWHCSLALPAGETVTADNWRDIAENMVRGMGLDPEKHQYVAVRHSDTDHDHIHIVASRIGLDGSVWHGKWEARRAIETTQALEKTHGLTITPGLENRPDDKRLTRGELNKAARTGQEPPRQALRRILDEARQGKPTAVQFAERVEAAGVEVRANLATTGKLNGFSFGYQGESYAAGRVADRFLWGKLSKQVSYEQDRDRQGLERFAQGAAASPGDPNRGRTATPVGRDQRADQQDPRDDRAADGGQPRDDQQDKPAAAIGSPGPDDEGSRDGLRSADSGAGRADPGGDAIDGHDQRPGEDGNTEVASVHPKGTGGHRGQGQQRGEGRGRVEDSSRRGQQAGTEREHSRPQHGQADGVGHGVVGLGGLAGDLRDLADRHVVTPEKARHQIAQAIEDEPAPRAHDNLTPPTRLQRWYGNLKTKLKDAVEKAREFFQERTEDSATAAGWQPDQLAEAGMEGPTANGWRERQRKDQEREQRQEQERQRRKDRVLAAERLSNEHQRIITEDEVAQDPNTGEWRYEPPEAPESPAPETPDDHLDLDDHLDDEPSGPRLG